MSRTEAGGQQQQPAGRVVPDVAGDGRPGRGETGAAAGGRVGGAGGGAVEGEGGELGHVQGGQHLRQAAVHRVQVGQEGELGGQHGLWRTITPSICVVL